MASSNDSTAPRKGFKLGGSPTSSTPSTDTPASPGKFKLGGAQGAGGSIGSGDRPLVNPSPKGDVAPSTAAPSPARGDDVASTASSDFRGDDTTPKPSLRFGGVSSAPSSGYEGGGSSSPGAGEESSHAPSVPLKLGGLKRLGGVSPAPLGGSNEGRGEDSVPVRSGEMPFTFSGGDGGAASPRNDSSVFGEGDGSPVRGEVLSFGEAEKADEVSADYPAVGEDFSSAVDDGFGDFFDDLDDYGRELEESFSSVDGSGLGASFDDDVEVVPGEGEVDDAFDAQLEELLGGEDELVAEVEKKDLLPDDYKKLAVRKEERDADVEHRRKKASRKAAKRLAKNSGSTVYKKPLRGVETKRAERGPREVLVDGQGEWHKPGVASSAEEFDVLFNRLSGAAEVGADVAVSPEDEARAVDVNPGKLEVKGKVIFPLVRGEEAVERESGGKKKQRLNEGELKFYRSLRSSKKEVLDSQAVRDVMRMPTSGVGSTAVVKAQRAVVAGRSGSLQSQWGGALRSADFEILQFLAKFRYAHHEHLARLWGVKPVTAVKHLRKLEAKGLVERVKVVNTHAVWVLTSAGMLLSGYDLPLVTAHNMSPQLIPHQFTVNHIAANLWGGQLNVLDLDEWPVKNRVDVNGLPRFGEELVSETQLHSSFASVKGLSDATVFRERVKNLTDDAFERWEARGGAAAGIPSPEFEPGNEFMWILFPPASVRRAYHFPDLVLRRPRNPDGSPESIAIEIETVAAKGEDRYRPALKAYNFDTRFYKKVIWVCRTNASNNSIVKGSKSLDLWRENRIEVVSILTDDGIFESRDLWKI